jgi:hypothetical protein
VANICFFKKIVKYFNESAQNWLFIVAIFNFFLLSYANIYMFSIENILTKPAFFIKSLLDIKKGKKS